MSNTTSTDYTLEGLEGASMVSARTIRYYISQGLVPPPVTVGRNATYSGEKHLSALLRITELKSQGMSLEAIKQAMDPKNQGPALPRLQPWGVMQPTDDVAVFIKTDVPPWRRNQIDKALVPFVAAVTRKNNSEEG